MSHPMEGRDCDSSDVERRRNREGIDAVIEGADLHVQVRKGSKCRADPKGCDVFEAIPTYFRHNTFNGNQPCDMLVGPCSCGATHSASEWVLVRVMP